MQFFLEKDFYIFLDFFCVLFGADNADYKIIGVTVVLDFLEAFLKRIVIVLISGTIVVENVFSWPGLGTLCISSIFNRDYPVIQTYVLLIGVLFVLFNLLFDILQTVSDPRLRKED